MNDKTVKNMQRYMWKMTHIWSIFKKLSELNKEDMLTNKRKTFPSHHKIGCLGVL